MLGSSVSHFAGDDDERGFEQTAVGHLRVCMSGQFIHQQFDLPDIPLPCSLPELFPGITVRAIMGILGGTDINDVEGLRRTSDLNSGDAGDSATQGSGHHFMVVGLNTRTMQGRLIIQRLEGHWLTRPHRRPCLLKVLDNLLHRVQMGIKFLPLPRRELAFDFLNIRQGCLQQFSCSGLQCTSGSRTFAPACYCHQDL
ncbi:hypothetical protein PS918_01961 [Pseudomonas fluorescens]|uniref:Uncharacterized protein n=1 Tax=Pseudomonas fluorescens TaxID=294 RepID=A0A5E7RTD7_PSEFL|nr:hypothetical protein PS918_01961 [Pseudomonas fluorescens]